MKYIKKIIFILLLIIFILIFIIIKININNTKEVNFDNTINVEKKKNIYIVTNSNMYFTVETCVQKYLSYLQKKDKEVLYNLIDKEYKNEFEITKENVLEYVEDIVGDYNFLTKTMYFEEEENKQIYYVKGEILEEVMDEVVLKGEEFCVTVILDMQNKTYTIIPYGYGGFYE